MNDKIIDPEDTVSESASGEETKPKSWDLNDAATWAEPSRREFTVPAEMRCRFSKAGNPTFFADIAAGTLAISPKGTPADCVGKTGTLVVGVLPNTKLVPSELAGYVMFSKPVTFVRFA